GLKVDAVCRTTWAAAVDVCCDCLPCDPVYEPQNERSRRLRSFFLHCALKGVGPRLELSNMPLETLNGGVQPLCLMLCDDDLRRSLLHPRLLIPHFGFEPCPLVGKSLEVAPSLL